MTLEEMLNYAMRVARKLWHDPESESIAGEAAWRAWRTFDEERGVPAKYWVRLLVKQDIYNYWRKLKARPVVLESNVAKEDAWKVEGESWDTEPLIPEVHPFDWSIIVMRFIDKWPIDLIARRTGTSIPHVRNRIAAAVSRLEAALDD